ncbi:MAG TPA: hypothetical protein VHF45_10140 [Thermoleophilaceae bacterium]|nr:hypothetical protein [Thermoleophilaceae bacterium]
MNERLDAARERLNYDSAHALFERNYRLLNEHDVRHIPTIFTEDIESKDHAWSCCSGRDQRALDDWVCDRTVAECNPRHRRRLTEAEGCPACSCAIGRARDHSGSLGLLAPDALSAAELSSLSAPTQARAACRVIVSLTTSSVWYGTVARRARTAAKPD